MKNNQSLYSITVLLLIACSTKPLLARPEIVLTFQPYAKELLQSNQEKFTKSLEKPGKVGSILLRYGLDTIPPHVGIFVSYWGYLGVTDFSGMVSFIRHTVKPEIQFLITPIIEPIMMFGTTVHHWVVKPQTPAALYSYKRIQEKDTKKYSWQITKRNVSYNQPISLQTIIIFADPKVIVPTTAETRINPNLILPSFLVKRSINKVGNALKVLTLKHFFSPVRFTDKKVGNTYFIELQKP